MGQLAAATTRCYLALVGHVLAFESTNATFSDDSVKPDATSAEAKVPLAEYVDHGLRIGPENQKAYHWVNRAHGFSNESICVSFIQPKLKGPTKALIGIDFWSQDLDNYWALEVDGVGSASVWSLIKAKWTRVSNDTFAPSYIKKPKARNDIMVELSGNAGTVSVNGAKVLEFTGQVPTEKWSAGPWVENNTGNKLEVVFNNVAMIQLP